MSTVLLGGLLVAVVVVATPVADRLRLPLPVLLTALGLLLPLAPGTPDLSIDPDVILPVVLPPLLFAATQRTTAREFRESAAPILLLAVGLTVATAAVVAWRRPRRRAAVGGRLGARGGRLAARPGRGHRGRPPAAAARRAW